MAAALLSMQNISKRFGTVQALEAVDFELREGQVHALVGKNGAGKSTLMKILAGVQGPDTGRIVINGRGVLIDSPVAARSLGISIVYQEFSLAPSLSVAENVFLGRLPQRERLPLVDWSALHDKTRALLARLESHIDPRTRVAHLSVAQQQVVEIAKALSFDSNILIMDEPTSALSDEDAQRLLETVGSLQEQGVGIVYISHRLAEVEHIADRVTVLRDGKVVGTGARRELSHRDIVRMMIGDQLAMAAEKAAPPQQKEVVLSVRNLCRGDELVDISFDLHRGEVLGIAGLVGAGRTELVRAIFGLDSIDSGEIQVDGVLIGRPNPRLMKRRGMGLTPENRKEEGLLLKDSVLNNTVLTILGRTSPNGVVDRQLQRQIASQVVTDLDIVTPSLRTPVGSLSGGNQQKVVLAKWLVNEPKILILDEPTRGVDIGAKVQLFSILKDLAEEGVSIIFISSELEEVLAVSHRVLTMYNGAIVAEFEAEQIDMQDVLLAAVGGHV